MTGQASKRLFIFAGEPSGDLHGGNLLKALKPRLSGYAASGVGGPEMRRHGFEEILGMEDFAVMGFTDVVKSLPKLIKQFYKVRDYIIKSSPGAVVLIDYPGFNLRLAKALRKQGYKGKIIQYVCPSVWAYGKRRIEVMARHLDLLMTIYPFEHQLFNHTGLKAEYVGNPLQEYIRNYSYESGWMDDVGVSNQGPLFALFPGSREGEIKRNLPLQLQASCLLKSANPSRLFAVSCTDQRAARFIEGLIEQSPLKKGKDIFLVPKQYTYELMKDSRTAIAKSGTVALELALHCRPTVAVYILTALNRFLARKVMKLSLPHYCIVNILGQRTVFPELIEQAPTPQKLFQLAQQLDHEGLPRSRCLEESRRIAEILENKDASLHAARLIEEAL